jgi:UDP-N-acetylenolpyruvoylglucosamine reductase
MSNLETLKKDLPFFLKTPCVESNILAPLTSFQIGGKADFFCRPVNKEDLVSLQQFAVSGKIPFFVIGGGSNILISDNGFKGFVIHLQDGFNKITIKDSLIYAGAGVKLGHLLGTCAEHGLSGFEFLTGIPGTVGGILSTNAGAFGYDTASRVKTVEILKQNGQLVTMEAEELSFGYRRGCISNYEIITEAVFELEFEQSEKIKERMHLFMKKKRASQPIGEKSAGCVFKNPEGTHAGKLIDDVGLKGFEKGNAKISPIHANFIVNCGGAKAKDVIYLMDTAMDRVFNHFSIKLEPELKIIGDR